jgi:hypothetical protein
MRTEDFPRENLDTDLSCRTHVDECRPSTPAFPGANSRVLRIPFPVFILCPASRLRIAGVPPNAWAPVDTYYKHKVRPELVGTGRVLILAITGGSSATGSGRLKMYP